MNESILHKIKQLHLKAQSSQANGDLHEAEMFASKVTALLREYNIEMSDVEGFRKRAKEDITELAEDELIKYNSVPSDGQWEISLLTFIANNNFCNVLYWQLRKQATIVGSRTNIEVVKYMYDVLRIMIKDASGKAYSKEVERCRNESVVWATDNKDAESKIVFIYGFKREDMKGNVIKLPCECNTVNMTYKFAVKDPSKTGQLDYRSVWIPQFLKGAAEGVNYKLISERNTQSTSVVAKTNEIMVINKFAVDEYITKTRSKVTMVASKPVTKSGAYQMGVDTGKNLSISKGLDSNNIKSLE